MYSVIHSLLLETCAWLRGFTFLNGSQEDLALDSEGSENSALLESCVTFYLMVFVNSRAQKLWMPLCFPLQWESKKSISEVFIKSLQWW